MASLGRGLWGIGQECILTAKNIVLFYPLCITFSSKSLECIFSGVHVILPDLIFADERKDLYDYILCVVIAWHCLKCDSWPFAFLWSFLCADGAADHNSRLCPDNFRFGKLSVWMGCAKTARTSWLQLWSGSLCLFSCWPCIVLTVESSHPKAATSMGLAEPERYAFYFFALDPAVNEKEETLNYSLWNQLSTSLVEHKKWSAAGLQRFYIFLTICSGQKLLGSLLCPHLSRLRVIWSSETETRILTLSDLVDI